MRRPIRSALVLGVLAGLVVALARMLGRGARPGPAPLAAPPAPLPATTAPAIAPVPVELAAVPAESEPEPAVPAPAAPAPTEPVPVPEPTAEPEVVAAGGGEVPTWVPPAEGACPDGYPIKAKESSGIYHQPGGLSYQRTRPDRCYPDAATAEADGYRAAKR